MTTEPVPTVVTHMTPYDLTGIHDSGMRALVLLAASLGWNVLQRAGNPIVITSRDGTQKRLPTNTSIRMSVYQTALSTIITHSQDVVPTVELIDKIVETVKLDRDHERRMRLAIGESAEEHKRRLATVPAAEHKREPDEHLTQHIEVPVDEVGDFPVAADSLPDIEFVEELPPSRRPQDDLPSESPADGEDHGKLISREPFIAHHHSAAKSHKSMIYQSDTSLERIWEDGFKDYECVICGRAYRTSKGVGAHSQVHTKAGEKDTGGLSAFDRAVVKGVDLDWVPKITWKRKPEPEQEEPVAEFTPFEGTDAESILEAVIELVSPNLRKQRDDAMAALAELQGRYDKLDADWKALRDLITR